MAASPRPSTAPAATSMERRSSSSCGRAAIAAIEEEEEDEASDDGGDPEPLLANASSTLYGLQNTWREERRSELNRLCRDLERSYGLAPSAGLLDEIMTPRPECSNVTESSLGGEPEPEVDSRGPESAEEELDEKADAVCAAAAAQLESIKELRCQVQERLQTPTADAMRLRTVPPAEDGTAGEAAALPASLESPADEDAKRLAALRLDVEHLKVKATEPTEQSLLEVAECEDQIRAQHASVLETKPISELAALDQWIHDMKKFCRDPAGTSKRSASPSRRCGANGVLSNRAMAEIAEARMDSSVQKDHEESCCSPSGGSPTASRLRGSKLQSSGSPSRATKKASSLLSPTASSSGRATVATPLNGRGAASPSQKGNEEKSAVEQQLDDILSEFDEIDRIHSHICKLTRG